MKTARALQLELRLLVGHVMWSVATRRGARVAALDGADDVSEV